MARTLIIAGGVYHPVAETGTPLAEILGEIGWESEVTADVENGLARLGNGEFDHLTLACLRFTMVQSEKYAPFRAEWALSLSKAARFVIRDYLASGRGLLAVHTAPISFDDWPEWPAILGVGWRWGKSFHPPMASADVKAMKDHPITRGMKPFSVVDEIYSDLHVEPWMQPLAEARHADMGAARPVVYAGEKDGARRAWCGLGHDSASLANQEHRALIMRAARWTAGEI